MMSRGHCHVLANPERKNNLMSSLSEWFKTEEAKALGVGAWVFELFKHR